jgi:hypothetical protein
VDRPCHLFPGRHQRSKANSMLTHNRQKHSGLDLLPYGIHNAWRAAGNWVPGPRVRREIIVEALLSLEPRLAGQDVMEPDIDFADRVDELHMVCDCLPGTEYLTNPPRTYYCEESSKICNA